MSDLRLAFLVNGGAGSAAAERAQRIAVGLGWERSTVLVRRGSRVQDVVAFARAVRAAEPDVVYAMDLAVVPLLADALARRHRRWLVVDTGDAPAAFLDLVGARLPARLAARALERFAYRSADMVVVRGHHHVEPARRGGARHIVVIPDGVDLEVMRPVDDEGLRRRLGLDGVPTVGIQGHFTWYPKLGGGLGWELVHALALRPDTGAHAVLIGDGPGIGELRVLAAELGVAERLHVIGRVPYAELARYLGICDVCLLTQTDDPSSWVRTTGKLPTYLASGRYVLASRVGSAADVLPPEMLLDYEGAWDASYPARLADRLAEVIADPDRRAKGLALCELARGFDYRRVAAAAAEAVDALPVR
ncbi:MAG: glycosyltransferase [Acidimicrobiales bacterium]|nr:glycosyltransferase [Acidimicrobiales bacterium]